MKVLHFLNEALKTQPVPNYYIIVGFTNSLSLYSMSEHQLCLHFTS